MRRLQKKGRGGWQVRQYEGEEEEEAAGEKGGGGGGGVTD